MKKLFLILLILLVPAIIFAANAKTGRSDSDTTLHYEGVSVDTDPGASGFYSDPVTANWGRDAKIWLEITAVNGTTFTLQYKAQGQSSYTDYGTYTAVGNYEISSNPSTVWRIGIADDNQGTAGTAQISW